MPLPEVLVAEFRMAFTASWMASVPLEFVEVELEELDCPRSWLSDSVLELPPKLDSSELMELVLIPLLSCASAAHRSSGVTLANYGIGKFQISLRLWCVRPTRGKTGPKLPCHNGFRRTSCGDTPCRALTWIFNELHLVESPVFELSPCFLRRRPHDDTANADYDFTSTLGMLASPTKGTLRLSPIRRSASEGISNNTSPVLSLTTT